MAESTQSSTPTPPARSRFTDTEWAMYQAGKCGWQLSYGTPNGPTYCEKPGNFAYTFRYCDEHQQEAIDSYGTAE